jgi:PTH1 family peptidyl-tRNA hydrolase
MNLLLLGLGNPGSEYVGTRHNIGFAFLEYFATQKKLVFSKKWKALSAFYQEQDREIFLLAPLTFMNLSGQSLKAFRKDLKVPFEQILVIHDDVYLETGSFRFKKGGSEAGHRGLESLTGALACRDYPRLRIGVGPFSGNNLSNFVLESFSKVENNAIFKRFPRMMEGVNTWIHRGVDAAMNDFNGQNNEN